MLLTGYFSITKKVSWKRLILLLLAMEFYSVGVAIIWKCSGMDVHGWKNALFPFLFAYNWYVACYLIFMCFVPYLNPFLNFLSKIQYGTLIILFFLFYNVIPPFHGETFMNKAPILQFALLYMIGGYLKLYGLQRACLKRGFNWGKTSFILFLLTDGIVLISWLTNHNIWRFVGLLSTCLAVSLFMIAANTKLTCIPWVNRLATSVLGVYLIHENPLVRPLLWKDVLPNSEFLEEPYFVFFFFLKVLCVYASCLVIDQLRLYLWGKIVEKWVDKHWEIWCQIIDFKRDKYTRWLNDL